MLQERRWLKMEETVFNLFVYVEGDYVTELGVVRHRIEGTDDQKLALLQAHVLSDSRAALRLAIPPRHLISYTDGEPPSLQYATFRNMMLVGQHLDLFEDAFEGMAASESPLVCVTPVVDGEPRIEEVIRKDFAAGDHPTRIRSHTIAPDYLESYLTENGFDFPRLFNDDFFDAIRLAYNHRRYVSSLKLLVSFIDTAAYLEFGDTPGNFQGFLDYGRREPEHLLVDERLLQDQGHGAHVPGGDGHAIDLAGRFIKGGYGEARPGLCGKFERSD